MTIIWRERALEDLEKVYEYLALLNPRAAVDLYNSILDEADILLNHPYLGSIQQLDKEMEFPLRGLLMRNRIHKVMYIIDNETIFITQVWDCRSDPSNIRPIK